MVFPGRPRVQPEFGRAEYAFLIIKKDWIKRIVFQRGAAPHDVSQRLGGLRCVTSSRVHSASRKDLTPWFRMLQLSLRPHTTRWNEG